MDDITVFVTHPTDIKTICHAVRTYEQATGAQLNPQKSKALTLWGWSAPISLMGIELYQQVKILGVMFGSTLEMSTKENRTSMNNVVCAQARKAYDRNLCLTQRIKYVQTCLLAKIWYLAQILPPPTCHVQQLMTICTWFIWKGATFHVPVTTLQQPKDKGGWALTDIALKCRTLLLSRLWTLVTWEGSIMAAFLRKWHLTGIVENPPYAGHIPSKLEYIHQYAIDMAYVPRSYTYEPLHKM